MLSYLPAGLGDVLLQRWHEAGDVGVDAGPEVSLERWEELVTLLQVRRVF